MCLTNHSFGQSNCVRFASSQQFTTLLFSTLLYSSLLYPLNHSTQQQQQQQGQNTKRKRKKKAKEDEGDKEEEGRNEGEEERQDSHCAPQNHMTPHARWGSEEIRRRLSQPSTTNSLVDCLIDSLSVGFFSFLYPLHPDVLLFLFLEFASIPPHPHPTPTSDIHRNTITFQER